ncbi:low temperature requirement protein A [Actinopolymorpha sp. B9G3]|uniref:low temperature requirement protein A n=1 Tax=Actinopolymorpha sp. B9G3 TaxID=3158970 RepID=UPI0032D8F4A3
MPVWAERAGRTAWHRYHIAERYGLFTIIVLGESVLAATIAVQTALDENRASAALYEVVLGGLLIVFAMWWLYFAKPAARFLDTNRAAFVWSYGHYLIFAAAAAVGAGLSVVIDQQTDHGELGRTGAGAAVTVPVAVYLLTLWFLHVRPHGVRAARTVLYPVTAVLVLATTWTGVPVLLSGLLLTGLAAATFVIATRDDSSGDRLEDQPAGR